MDTMNVETTMADRDDRYGRVVVKVYMFGG